MSGTVITTATTESPALPVPVRRVARSDLAARGEPFVWIMGAALVAGLAMITGFLGFVIYVGALTFWPQPIAVITTTQDKIIAGEAFRSETYKPRDEQLASASPEARAKITADLGIVERTLYRTLFLCALVLFVMTFVINTVAELVRQRYRKRAAQL